jgi:enoyl-CoA hydratase/carnithine racemase
MQTPQTSPEILAEFFHEEYKLNHLIGTFKKPIIALMDGITSTL